MASSNERATRLSVVPQDIAAPAAEPPPEPPAAPAAPAAAAAWHVPPSGVPDPLLQCLVTVAALFERPRDAEAFAAGLPLVDGRLTPELFVRAAARAGLAAAVDKRTLRRIPGYTLPCVLLLEERSACVLQRVDGDTAEVLLPETGRGASRMPLAELERIYAGYVIFVRPDARFDSRLGEARRERPSSWFWGTIFSFWPVYLEVAIAALMVNIFALTGSLFAMNVYDRVVPNNAIETLWVLAIGAGVVFGFDLVLRSVRNYFLDHAGSRADVMLASRIFEHVLGMRMAGRPASAGAFANHLREFETLRDFFTSSTLTALIDLPFALLFILVIWQIGGPLAFVPAVAFPVVAVIGLLIQIPLNRAVRRSFVEATQKHGMLVETIGGLETIKSLGAEGRTLGRWEGVVGQTARSATRARTLSALAINFSLFAQNAVSVLMIIVGVYMIAEGTITLGALIACTMLASRAMLPLSQVAALATRLDQSLASLDALNKVMALPVERPADAHFVHRADLRGDIEFKNVGFSYPNQRLGALNGLNLAIRAGERVGIIGRIGSGKSTIARLMIGLYEPQSGSILVDGTDLRQIDPASLRRRVGCVLQDVYLFYGTVRDNILAGAPHADDAALLRAAHVAGVDEFANRHPLGYDMPVGERGELLSGGQRQAIAVARGVVGDPSILILDEPTSAMDNSSEALLKMRLTEILPGKTLILITHRSSLLSLVDRLVVVDGGRVVADGPRESVLSALAQGKVRTGKG
jgi:ATP-binding cassette subfamily C protein LapB